MIIPAKLVPADVAVEINTYEQLRELDSNSNQLKSDAIETASKALNTTPEAITRITVLKRDDKPFFPFNCNGRKYIMRIPGEGTDKLINRKQEANVYQKSTTNTFVTISYILTLKMDIRSLNLLKTPEYAIHLI